MHILISLKVFPFVILVSLPSQASFHSINLNITWMNLALWNPPFISLKLCESQARQPGHHRLLPCSNIYPILVWVHGHIDQYMVKHEVLVSILVLSIEMLHMGIKEWNEEIKMNQSMDDWRLTFLFIVKNVHRYKQPV